MSRHYQSLPGAAVLATEDLLDARDLIGDISDAVAMGAIYGPAGTGKSFAVDEAIADRAEPDHTCAPISAPDRRCDTSGRNSDVCSASARRPAPLTPTGL